MSNDKLTELSMEFAVQIINLVKQLKEQRESIISNQIGRSGTSIGANIREAKYAHGFADFYQKCKLHLRKQMKPAIGWNYFTEPDILARSSTIILNQNANPFVRCLLHLSIQQRIIPIRKFEGKAEIP